MPPPNLKFSVFRIDSLSVPEIWKIGLNQVIAKMPEPRTLYGRADIQAKNVLKTGLQFDPDNKPPRHANIVNWPETKEEQKSIAQELAADATLELRT